MPATHVHVSDPVLAEVDPDQRQDGKETGVEDINDTVSPDDGNPGLLYGSKSPGVRRIEVISAQFRTIDKVFFLLSIFFVAYAYGLDLQVRSTYQTQATASYSTHSLLSTVNILKSVIAAAAQPTAAKIADVFGRVELVFVAIVFYTVGTIVETFSHGVKAFCGGAVLYQIGYTCISLMCEVIIADTTSLRSRLVFSFIPSMPFIINTWVGGNITSAVLANSSWRWGIGMFAIIFPVSTIPLLITMFVAHRRARKNAELESYKTPFQSLGFKKLAVSLFWQLDVIGIILLIAVFALILVPFSIAGGVKTTWKTAHVIAPLVVGVCYVPVWIWWEKTCKHPMIPFRLLTDRAVWGAMGIAIMLDFVWELQGSYLYTVLFVAFGESVESSTRISSLYSFVSVLSGTGLGLIVFYVRRLKGFIVFGTCLFMVAFGILIRFRGGSDGKSGIIGAEVLLGFAGGLFPYPTQANIQSATKHEHLAVITGIFLAAYNIGSAIGGAIAGAIWSQVLPGKLEAALGNATLATSVYGDPITFAEDYAWDTPERQAAVGAYRSTQRLLCITGICLCIPLIAFSLVLRDPKLGKEQSLPNAEENIPIDGTIAEKEKNEKREAFGGGGVA